MNSSFDNMARLSRWPLTAMFVVWVAAVVAEATAVVTASRIPFQFAHLRLFLGPEALAVGGVFAIVATAAHLRYRYAVNQMEDASEQSAETAEIHAVQLELCLE